ncbi:hypothetical protein AB3N58_17650 (plasmid) [Leptospira sp. WS60.C2]
MIFQKNIYLLILLLISCKPANLDNPADPYSTSGLLTRILLSRDSTTSNEQNPSQTSSAIPFYNVTVRVYNMAGSSGSADAAFSLNGGVSETVSTVGNAVRDKTFSTQLTSGAAYSVSVISQPSVGSRICNIPSSTGLMPANSIIIDVYCFGLNNSAGTVLTVNNSVGASANINFSLDGNPGSTVAINLSSVASDFTFDVAGLNSAQTLSFTTTNSSMPQNVTVYRQQLSVQSPVNVTYTLAPFIQMANILLRP